MLVDCFQIDGDADFTAYPRTKLLYYDTEDGSPHLYETSDVKVLETLGITLTHTAKNTSQCKKLHMWKYYMELLQEIYGDAIITRVCEYKNKLTVSRSKTRDYNRTRARMLRKTLMSILRINTLSAE